MHFLKVRKSILISFCLLLFTLVPTSLLSQVNLPNTPAGNRANEILILINSGDAEKTEKYVEENYAQSFKDAFPMGKSFDTWHKNLFSHPAKGGQAGGVYSTVEDLLKFDIALRNNILLDTEHFKTMTTGKVERDEQTQYAYLFQEKFINGHRIIGHSGGAGGINSHLSMYMDLGYTVAIMSNYDPPAAMNIAKKLEELLTQN